MSDFLIDDMAVHLAASKNADYRSRVRHRFNVFVAFLQDNGLTTRTLTDQNLVEADNLKIMRSDLTGEGYEVVRAAYDKWLRGHDKGKAIDDVTPLRKALEKIR